MPKSSTEHKRPPIYEELRGVEQLQPEILIANALNTQLRQHQYDCEHTASLEERGRLKIVIKNLQQQIQELWKQAQEQYRNMI